MFCCVHSPELRNGEKRVVLGSGVGGCIAPGALLSIERLSRTADRGAWGPFTQDFGT